MRILVTGGAGYIGSILAPMLLDKGYHVVVFDNLMYSQTPLLDCCFHKNLKIVTGDVSNQVLLRELIEQTDAIIPLACIVGAPACDKNPCLAQNVNLFQIFDINRAAKRRMVIFPNTNSGYGTGQESVFCDENTPLNPISLYGKLKVEAEKAIIDRAGISLRLATVFGISPRMRLDLLVNDFVYRAVNDKYLVLFESHFKRNYIHVRDVARAFIHAIENFDTMKSQAYNVGLSDANLSKWELCEEIKKQIPDFYFTQAPLRKDPDQRNYIVSNARIEATGFRPMFSLPDGISELIKGFQIVKQNKFSNI